MSDNILTVVPEDKPVKIKKKHIIIKKKYKSSRTQVFPVQTPFQCP